MSVGPTLDNTWGASFIGLVLAAILYGITITQTYLYFTMYPEDGWMLKLLAGSAFVLDSTSMALITYAMYTYLITNMVSPVQDLVVNRAFDIEPSLMGTIAFLTHLYLGLRVWKVCKRNIWLGLLLGILMFGSLGLAFASSVVSWRYRTWLQLKAEIKTLALAGIITSILLDTIIASVLCVFLVRQDVEGRKTRRLIRKVLFFAINTGLASSLMSILNLATFLAYPDTMIFLSLTMLYTKVYANALLANLNAREHLRVSVSAGCGGTGGDSALSLNLSALRTHPYGPRRGSIMLEGQTERVEKDSAASPSTSRTEETFSKV